MKKVVFSAITGGYDSIFQPPFVPNDFDFIIFSNDFQEQQQGIWQIRKIPYSNDDNIRVARWVKTHPHILLKEYEYSIWIDSNVVIRSEDVYRHADNLYNQGVVISSMNHPERHCAYAECLEVAIKKRDSLNRILPELLFLKHHSYPEMNGLCETNFVFRVHLDPKVQKLCNDWWTMINSFSRRDQLSFNYVLWNNHIKIDYFLGNGFNVRNHPDFDCTVHRDFMFKYKMWLRHFEKYASKIYAPAFGYLFRCPNNILKESVVKQYLYMMEFLFNQIHKIYCSKSLRIFYSLIKKLGSR